MNMRQIVTTILMLACVAITWTGDANGTPPRQLDLGVLPLDSRAEKGEPVQLEFHYTKSIGQWNGMRLEFNPVGDLKYLGPEEVHLAIRKDTTVTFQFEVIPDPADTSGIVVIPWFDEGNHRLPVSIYFIPSGDSLIMRGSDPRGDRKVTVRFDSSNYVPRTPPPDAGRRPSDSAKIRARLEQQKRDFAPYQLEIELQRKAELEQSPLTDLDAQHIRVGDTIFTRKKGEQYFYPAEKVSSSSPPLWAIDTKAFLDKLLDEEKPPYHLAVKCPDSACVEFLNDIADTVFLVPWSDRYQVTLNKKGLKKLRETDYKVLPGEHINKQP